jgi:hypothetical protein
MAKLKISGTLGKEIPKNEIQLYRPNILQVIS